MRVRERPVLVAPDSFKGTFRAAQVAGAIGRGLERAGLMPPDLLPLADGGDGTLDALLVNLGGETVSARVRDPLGRDMEAGYALVEDGGTALIEVAAASGLSLVAQEERDAWAASTYGTGQLIVDAVDRGARVILVAVGGSATTDGGAGALEAIEAAGAPRAARIVVLSDVQTPWERCAEVYGPQKGADPAMVRRLADRLDELADRLPEDPRGVPMTGAAGGRARRADGGRGGRPPRRPRGPPRREPRGGSGVDPRRTGLRRPHARRPRRRHGRGQARRADAPGQARRRGRDAHAPGRRTAPRDRRDGRARRVRQADDRPPGRGRGDDARRDRRRR